MKHEYWTWQTFWAEPWTRSDIISAWSTALTLLAIFAALGIAGAERWHARLERRRHRQQLIEEAMRILGQGVGACERTMEMLDRPAPADVDPRGFCDTCLSAFRRAFDAVTRLAPAEGSLSIALTQASDLLEPLIWTDVGMPEAWSLRDAIDFKRLRLIEMIARLDETR